jgi:hypothetical protein
MTVKVIKVEPSKEVVKEAICKGCGATLEYVPNDVKSRHGTDYGGGPDGEEWIDCPNCQQRVVLRSW